MRGHIRQRGPNAWELSIFVGRDGQGKKAYKWFTVHGGRKDAERELRKILRDMDTNSFVDPSKMTVGEYLERWLTDYAAIKVAGTTFQRYESVVRHHLVPDLGAIRLSQLKPLDIQRVYAQWLRGGRKDKREGGLTAQTVHHHHTILKGALRQAVRWQLIGLNPAEAVEPPTPNRRERQTYTAGQVNAILEAARGDVMYMPILLAVTTGMRRGEILALKWSDVDLEKGILSVQRSLEQVGTKITAKKTKTKRSMRSIQLLSLTVEELRRHKTTQAKNKLQWGAEYENNGLICTWEDGRLMKPNYMSRLFMELVRKLDLPKITFHDLRHTHATLLLQAGVHPKIVSERLGHSTISQTMDTYSHVLPNMQEEAALKLDKLLKG